MSRSLPVTFFSAASTTPSFESTPRTVPACEIASMAYSTGVHESENVRYVVRDERTLVQTPCSNKSAYLGKCRHSNDIPSGEKIVVRPGVRSILVYGLATDQSSRRTVVTSGLSRYCQLNAIISILPAHSPCRITGGRKCAKRILS